MLLRYHQAAYVLLGQSPTVSQDAIILLEQQEKALGRELPASVREWYSLDGAVDILAEYSNQDHPISLSSLGDLSGRISQEALAQNLLLVMHDNQSVCH